MNEGCLIRTSGLGLGLTEQELITILQHTFFGSEIEGYKIRKKFG
jgi:hypothetical protein